MNRKLIIPAIIVGAAHAAFLFGIPKPEAEQRAPIEKTYEVTDIGPLPSEPPEPAKDVLEAEPVDVTSIAPPTLLDLPAQVTLSSTTITMTPAPYVPQSGGIDVVTIPVGNPRGTVGRIDPKDYAIDVGSLDNVPNTKFRSSPLYPATLRAQGVTGQVLVSFIVDEEGRVSEARVMRSAHPDFEEPTLRAVSKWRFEPGRKNGKAVRFKMSVPVMFSLNDAD